MKELFEIFSNNMNTVYSEIRQQKALIAGIENKIAEKDYKTSFAARFKELVSVKENELGLVYHPEKI